MFLPVPPRGSPYLRAMGIVALAITIERVLSAGHWVSKEIGGVVTAAGLLLIARATGLA
jgi:hypothetical protein